MKVADSSYLVEGLLKRKELFEKDLLVTVDLAVYEAANSIWKHQCLLKDLDDGLPYVSILHGLIESGRVRIIHPGRDLMEKAYTMAAKNKRTVYDAIFAVLALELGTELLTLDKSQSRLVSDPGS
jgi:predicted nucleic acid-binding protein